jgi:hypothetical protein
MAEGTLPQRYRESMKSLGLGYALFEPAPYHGHLRPGILGYLDEYQRWHPLLDVSDPNILTNSGYSAVGWAQPMDADVRTWKPKKASNVKETSISLENQFDPAAFGLPVPINLGEVLQFSTKTDFGGVLVCSEDVVSEGFNRPQQFLEWLKHKPNMKLLLENYPELRTYGVTVATWTYSCNHSAITTWDNPENTVTVGFNVGLPGVMDVDNRVSWVRGRSATSDWCTYQDQKRVVIFTGVKIRFGTFRPRQELEAKWRGEGDDFVVADPTNEAIEAEAEVEFFGDSFEEAKKRV